MRNEELGIPIFYLLTVIAEQQKERSCAPLFSYARFRGISSSWSREISPSVSS